VSANFDKYEKDRYEAAAKDAEQFRDLVFRRTGLHGKTLVCPKEKSADTPCIARDGRLAVALSVYGGVCVGCERTVHSCLTAEIEKAGGRKAS
jgi:hypothetical protein